MIIKKLPAVAQAFLIIAIGAIIGFFLTYLALPRLQPPPRPPLERELNLSGEQREKIGKIWRDIFDNQLRGQRGQRGELRKALDEGILALIPENKKADYDRLQAEYRAKQEEANAERNRLFEKAVAETKSVLTAEQLKKYDEFLQKSGSRFRGGFPGFIGNPGGRHGGPDDAPPPPPENQPEDQNRKHSEPKAGGEMPAGK